MQFYKIKNEEGVVDDEGNGQMEERKNEQASGPNRGTKLLLAILIIASLAISRGYGIQLKYSILNDQSRQQFYPPFLLMWFNNSCLIICFPLYFIYAKICSSNSSRQIIGQSSLIFSKSKFKIEKFLCVQFIFLLFFNVNNYTNSLSLGRISTSAALSIHSLEVSIVYILGRFLLKEQFFLLKTLGVFLAMVGVILISLDNEFAADFLGVFLKLLGCMATSIYKIGFKRIAGNATPSQSMFFLSGMGLVNLFVNLPPAIILLHLGLESFHFEFVPWLHIFGYIFLTFIFNFSTIFGIALLSPVIVSIGVLSGVPISIGIDITLRKHLASWKFIFGTILLLISIILTTFHEKIRTAFQPQKGDDGQEKRELTGGNGKSGVNLE